MQSVKIPGYLVLVQDLKALGTLHMNSSLSITFFSFKGFSNKSDEHSNRRDNHFGLEKESWKQWGSLSNTQQNAPISIISFYFATSLFTGFIYKWYFSTFFLWFLLKAIPTPHIWFWLYSFLYCRLFFQLDSFTSATRAQPCFIFSL